MIRWGAIVACLWAGAASAQTVPAAPAVWGCGEDRVAVAEGTVGTREQSRVESAGLDNDDTGGGEGCVVPKFVRFDLQAVDLAPLNAGLVLRLRGLPAQAGPLAADLQVEAEQSIAADPQAGQMHYL